MASVVSTNLVIARVATHAEGDFYDIYAWLRDTCIPNCRPLYNELNDHYDDELKAAALVKHSMTDGSELYELIIHHGNYEKRIKACIPRQPPTLADFIRHVQTELK